MGQNASKQFEQEMSPVIHENHLGSEYVLTGQELRDLMGSMLTVESRSFNS